MGRGAKMEVRLGPRWRRGGWAATNKPFRYQWSKRARSDRRFPVCLVSCFLTKIRRLPCLKLAAILDSCQSPAGFFPSPLPCQLSGHQGADVTTRRMPCHPGACLVWPSVWMPGCQGPPQRSPQRWTNGRIRTALGILTHAEVAVKAPRGRDRVLALTSGLPGVDPRKRGLQAAARQGQAATTSSQQHPINDPQEPISNQVAPVAAGKPPGPVGRAQPITVSPYQARTPPRGTGGA